MFLFLIGQSHFFTENGRSSHVILNSGPPFGVPGVNFMGAIYAKNERAVGEYEVYICLFTCASTQAVNLEVVTDLIEVTFLQAFQGLLSADH